MRLPEVYRGQGVVRVTVSATVTFDAYVFTDTEVTEDGIEVRIGRMEREIADAMEHHAPHLSDSEDDDCLIALTDGGTGTACDVTVNSYGVVSTEVTEAEVRHAIEHTKARM